jgi:hypothetical protein
MLEEGVSPPPGYTFIGTTRMEVREPGRRNERHITFRIYRKN